MSDARTAPIIESRGWGFPHMSRKAHYFIGGMSLCRKWGFFAGGRLEEGNHDSPDNCAACKRLHKRDLQPAVSK